ncbi:MAG: hypothetical protein MR526_07790 [Blautia sp.]|nr:hypothetical protein [Blautia sp.]MCI7289340.1 hypothetical protein [Blautia sp.]
MSKKSPLQNQRFKWWEHVTTFSYAKKAEVQDEYAPEIRDSAGNSCFYVPTGAEGYTSSSVYFASESGVYGYEMVDIGGGHQMLFGVDEDWQPWLGLRSETDLPDQVQLR